MCWPDLAPDRAGHVVPTSRGSLRTTSFLSPVGEVGPVGQEKAENGGMQGLADSYAFWVLLFLALAVVYLLPTLIGLIRGVERLALVFLVNLIGAPTGIGWVAAMILAFGPRRLPRGPAWPRTGVSAAMWRE